MKIKCIMAAAAVLLLSSCAKEGWSIKGRVDGAEQGTKLAIEAFNAGRWYVLDSVAVGSDGRFNYQAGEPMPVADILRLQYPGKGSVYFPVDSVDEITVEASASVFGTGHRLSGTALASAVASVDSTVAATADMSELRRKLTDYITNDTTGLIAYYAVGKAVDNKPVFDPTDNMGNRVYGAAAQVFARFRPLDPRGATLKQAYFEGRKALGKISAEPVERVVELPETGLFDIVRYDAKGTEHSLAEAASKGKVVLLSFTDYSLEGSPAYNAILNDLYKLYQSKGIDIYQIAFDGDEAGWKSAAKNLPWTAVWNAPSDGSGVLSMYNVGAVPMTFIIDRKGEIAARVVDPTDLPKEVAKYF